MISADIVELLYQKGYTVFDDQIKGVYVRESEDSVYVLLLGVYSINTDINQCQILKNRVAFKAYSRYKKNVQMLFLFLTENAMFDDNLLNMAETIEGVWFFAKDTGKFYVFENQSDRFDDLLEYLEEGVNSRKTSDAGFKLTLINTIIVLINVLVFLVILIAGGGYEAFYNPELMLKAGALSYHTFVNGAWYQIVTSIFLHFGFLHLVNNMVLLTYAGCELERRVGKISYFLIYFTTGIIGNVASLVYHSSIGEINTVSAGASGAVFGVIGALAVNLLVTHSETGNLTTRRLLFLAGITIYYGLTTIGVDNAAHIGGFLCGIIAEFILSKISQYVKLK